MISSPPQLNVNQNDLEHPKIKGSQCLHDYAKTILSYHKQQTVNLYYI